MNIGYVLNDTYKNISKIYESIPPRLNLDIPEVSDDPMVQQIYEANIRALVESNWKDDHYISEAFSESVIDNTELIKQLRADTESTVTKVVTAYFLKWAIEHAEIPNEADL